MPVVPQQGTAERGFSTSTSASSSSQASYTATFAPQTAGTVGLLGAALTSGTGGDLPGGSTTALRFWTWWMPCHHLLAGYATLAIVTACLRSSFRGLNICNLPGGLGGLSRWDGGMGTHAEGATCPNAPHAGAATTAYRSGSIPTSDPAGMRYSKPGREAYSPERTAGYNTRPSATNALQHHLRQWASLDASLIFGRPGATLRYTPAHPLGTRVLLHNHRRARDCPGRRNDLCVIAVDADTGKADKRSAEETDYELPGGTSRLRHLDPSRRDVTDVPQKILTDRGCSFAAPAVREAVQDVERK